MSEQEELFLRSSEQQRAILDSVGTAIITIDQNQVIRFVNTEAEAVWEYSRDELIGKTIHRLMPTSYRDAHDRGFHKRSGESFTDLGNQYRQIEGQRKSGEVFPIELRFTAVSIGDEVFVTAAARDISDRQKMHEQLERQHQQIAELNQQLQRERDYLMEEVQGEGAMEGIIGQSNEIKQLMSQVNAVARTNANVLILGESGVGKELVARAIHEQSDRQQHPLIKVNCGSIPKELFESEFFGHIKGAFTGATRDREGRFEIAHQGSIFLDEVGETPSELQVKLLRVIEEQEFERVGDNVTRRVDVRVIAATNRELQQEMKAGRFREDLFYRLGVFPITVPPLRDRNDDVIELARHFARTCSSQLNVAAAELTPDGEKALTSYKWPGNVRELKNVIERALILSDGKPLSAELFELLGVRSEAAIARLPEEERTEIENALRKHHGVIKQTASELGLSRQALYRRLEKHDIDPRQFTSPNSP